MGTNTKALNEGFKKFKKLMDMQMLDILTNASYKLLVDAEFSKEFQNLTGNTITSYMVGIFKRGKLARTIALKDMDRLPSPTRRKLSYKKDGVAIVEEYMTGNERVVRLKDLVETDKMYGYTTAKRFLTIYKPEVYKGYGIVMCTGTEYSDFLEDMYGLNVLTETFQISPRVLAQSLRPIE